MAAALWLLATPGARAVEPNRQVKSPTEIAAPEKEARLRAGDELCPRVRWAIGSDTIGLSATERLLVCGDTDTTDPTRQPWRTIPFNQKEFHLTAFLQDRGYFVPKFDVQGDLLVVDIGPKSTVKRLDAVSAPYGFDVWRRRGVLDATLTPKILDDMEGWSRRELGNIGYACPVVASKANAPSGVVTISTEPGPREPIVSVQQNDVPGVDGRALRRYDAFRLGDEFEADLLTLSERRILQDGFLQSVHFSPRCAPDGTRVVVEAVPGKKRLLTFGVGLNTEGVLLGRASWKNTRLGANASSLEAKAEASKLRQTIRGDYLWRPWPNSPRSHVHPAIELTRLNLLDVETVSLRGGVRPGGSHEYRTGQGTLEVGPSIEFLRVLRGIGPRGNRIVSLDTDATFESHGFEYFRTSPRKGWTARLSSRASFEAWGSDLTAHRIQFDGQKVWNYRRYDPPWLVAAVRWALRTTLTAERPSNSTRLVPDFLHWLGGSQDLRGFGRTEVPSRQGSLTALAASLELRMPSLLAYGFEPFLFLDEGVTGSEPVSVDHGVYSSPGLGLRWQSPVGVFRATVAHGYVAGRSRIRDDGRDLSHLQLYLSFGEEF